MKNNEQKEPYMHVHADVVKAVEKTIPKEVVLCDLAELYKLFGDTTRIRILFALLQTEMCVYDIALLLAMGQSAISHQLRLLKQSKLIKSRREGKNILYSLADEHVREILDCGLEHILEEK